MKTVLLEITNGPKAGQKIWIGLGVSIKIGSAQMADLIIENDRNISPLHAAIGHRGAGCFIECIETEGTVLVNGESTQRSRLKDGDTIVAGDTEFKVSVIRDTAETPPSVKGPLASQPLPEQAAPNHQPATPQAPGNQPAADENETTELTEPSIADPSSESHREANAATHPRTPEVQETEGGASDEQESDLNDADQPLPDLRYIAEQLSNQLWRLEPLAESSFPLPDVLDHLTKKFNCFACLDDRIWEIHPDLEAEIECRVNIGQSLSMVQMSRKGQEKLFETADLRQLATTVFSPQTLEKTSQLIAGHSFSFRRPNIFATQMEVATPGIAASIMSEISCVLISDRQGNWKIFTTVPVHDCWSDLGFRQAPSEIESREI
jgi:pSer/pThr/pTyr-binding forkhead associated (FHA) protein